MALEWAPVALPALSLGLGAALSGSPAPWIALVLLRALPKLAFPASPSIAAASQGLTLSLALLLCGHLGLFAVASAALLALNASRAPGLGARVAAGLFGGAALLVSAIGPVLPLIDAWALDCFGVLAVLLEAAVTLNAKPKAAQPIGDRQALAVLNHELRTPLNAIIGFAGLLRSLRQTDGLAERRNEYARIIEASGAHILTVLETALGDAPKSQAHTPINLNALVAECLEQLSPMANSHAVNLRLAKPAVALTALGEAGAIRQIVINTVANAIKFSPPGADVVVELRPRAGGRIEIAVADQGMGIAAADLKKLGTPYHRSPEAMARKIEGSGLGLSICRRLASELGGSLELESRADSGTTARLILTAAQSPQLSGKPKRRRPRGAYAALPSSLVNPMLAIGAR